MKAHKSILRVLVARETRVAPGPVETVAVLEPDTHWFKPHFYY